MQKSIITSPMMMELVTLSLRLSYEGSSFGWLLPGSHSFGHDTNFMTIGEDWNEDRPVKSELFILTQLFHYHKAHITEDKAHIHCLIV